MKKRLIDATPFEVYTGMVPDGFDENSYIAGCKEIMAKIWAAPTVDAVPVVRCDKCTHWDKECDPKFGDTGFAYCHKLKKVTKYDFFCGYGAKMDLKEDKPE